MEIWVFLGVIFFCSIVISWILIVVVKAIFFKYSLLDNPKKYAKNRLPVPYGMGIVFFLVFGIFSLFSFFFFPEF